MKVPLQRAFHRARSRNKEKMIVSEQSMAPYELYSPLTAYSIHTYNNKKGGQIHSVMYNPAPQNITDNVSGQYPDIVFSYDLLDDYCNILEISHCLHFSSRDTKILDGSLLTGSRFVLRMETRNDEHFLNNWSS